MATMASCGLPSLRTNGSSTLFNKNSGANAKMVRRYVTVSGSVASSAPKSDDSGAANASTTASSTAAATPAITSAVVNTRFAPVRSPHAEHTWNSVAAPMPSMRPVACSTVYSTMEKLSAARPSDPTPFAMKNVSARMYTDTPTMPSTLNDTYRANGRAIDDEPAMPAPRAIARRLTPRARCRMPRCARCRTPRLSRGRRPCCARRRPSARRRGRRAATSASCSAAAPSASLGPSITSTISPLMPAPSRSRAANASRTSGSRPRTTSSCSFVSSRHTAISRCGSVSASEVKAATRRFGLS